MKKISKAQPPRRESPVVLCGTDFSPAAAPAADVAAGLARGRKIALELVHATALPADPRPSEKLNAEVERLKKQGAAVIAAVLDGDAGDALVGRAKPGSCELVVVGSRGKSKAARWLLGSVSERTAERAAVPTLVVRDPTPLLTWMRGETPLKVFVAFNFTATSEAALRWVAELPALGACDIVIGFVDNVSEQLARLGGAKPFLLMNNPPEMQAILERDLRTRATELLGATAFRVRVEASRDRADVRLAGMAKEEGAGLIVVGSHQYHGFERVWHASASRGLLHGAAMSVAVVPLTTAKAHRPDIARPVRRVLVTTDFSDLANQAISHAYSLVYGGGTVHLVHVIHPYELPRGQFQQGQIDRIFASRHARHAKACLGKLRALIPAEAGALGIVSEVEIAEHPGAAEGILQAAERFAADVICIGAHGDSGAIASLLGSVAKKVMAKSSRPLFVVRALKP